MAIYPREDPRTALPQLEKKIEELSAHKEKTIVQATSDDATTITLATGTMTKIPVNKSYHNNDISVTVDESLGGVLIKQDGWYKVHASIYIRAVADANAVGTFIFKATRRGAYSSATEIMGANHASASLIQFLTSITPQKLIKLNAGDVLYLAGRCLNGSGDAYPDNQSTFLYIEQA